MERTPYEISKSMAAERASGKEMPKSSSALLGILRTGIKGRLTAVALALASAFTFAKCGQEPLPECEEEARAEASAPHVDAKNYAFTGNRLRVYFNTPRFDEECRAPINVEIHANVWINSQAEETSGAGGAPALSAERRLTQVNLNGGTLVFNAGDDFVEGELPAGSDNLSAFRLIATDAAGNVFAGPWFGIY